MDREEEIAREIVASATRKATKDGDICIIGHDTSSLVAAIAAALRAYGEEVREYERGVAAEEAEMRSLDP